MSINEEIRCAEVRLVGADGSQLGILNTKDALQKAYEQNLDLVQISPKAQPPVCKIMDYGKFRFEQAKREKEMRKNQKVVNIKEIRMSLSIDDHDLDTKIGHAKKFLEAGDKVKVTVRFKGREISHASLGEKVLLKFAEKMEEYGQMEKRPKLEGRSMSIFLVKK